jgi:hypothetical protein
MTVEEDFDKAMWGLADQIKLTFHQTPSRFIQMLGEMGGIRTARRLLASEKPAEGFTSLYESQRWDLSVENLVLKKEFQSLFTEVELAIARERLAAVGYVGE